MIVRKHGECNASIIEEDEVTYDCCVSYVT